MANKFRHHMEYGLHDKVATEIDDIGDRILQWEYQRDKLRTEIKQTLLLQVPPPLPQLPHFYITMFRNTTSPHPSIYKLQQQYQDIDILTDWIQIPAT